MKYQYDEQANTLIRIGRGTPEQISKSNPIWRPIDNDGGYMRAIYLGQGWWDRLDDISEEKALELIERWKVPSDSINQTPEKDLVDKKDLLKRYDKAIKWSAWIEKLKIFVVLAPMVLYIYIISLTVGFDSKYSVLGLLGITAVGVGLRIWVARYCQTKIDLMISPEERQLAKMCSWQELEELLNRHK